MILDSEDGNSALMKACQTVCKEINNELELHVVIDRILLQECFYSAKNSLSFYNLDEQKGISFYKEIGHIVYWIYKLKPIRLESPKNLLTALVRLGKAVDQSLFDEVQTYETKQAENFSYPVNERVALYMGLLLIESAQTQKLQQNKVAAAIVKRHNEILEEAMSFIRDQLSRDIAMSFRFHTYSARGTALFFEGLTRTQFV